MRGNETACLYASETGSGQVLDKPCSKSGRYNRCLVLEAIPRTYLNDAHRRRMNQLGIHLAHVLLMLRLFPKALVVDDPGGFRAANPLAGDSLYSLGLVQTLALVGN
jgi:hypothetical protein